jgi:hypothetical protein
MHDGQRQPGQSYGDPAQPDNEALLHRQQAIA